jgi:hypothetical protein
MSKSAIFVLLGLLAATVGCSARVKVESETWDRTLEASTGERARTAVEVDVLQPRPAVPSPNPPSSKPATSGSTTLINLGDGDVHVHQPPSQGTPPPKKSVLVVEDVD